MINRKAIFLIAGLAVATAATLVGTYYFVNWVAPPITFSMPNKR